MSRKGKQGKGLVVLREARRQSLPLTRSKCLQAFTSEFVTLTEKKNKKRIKLQTRLTEQQDIYDDKWIGDSMESSKKQTIRFWYQNCNGLLTKNDIREFQFDIATLADLGVNYFSFAETCINVNKPGFQNKLEDAFSEIIPNGQMRFINSPKYPKRSNYQPGGISAGYDSVLRTRFLREGHDKLGRWAWQEFGQNKMITRVYTLYRVNAGSEFSSGHTTAWYQQKMLLEEAGSNANPRQQVLIDLIQEIQPEINNGRNILVFGDFNEGYHSPEGLSKKLENIGLYNVMVERLGSTNLPRTHARGSTAIDHVWATKHILDNIQFAGIAPFGTHYQSDHRGFFIDINENMLFHKDDTTVIYHEFRRLKSTVPKRVTKYMKILSTEWETHKIDEKFEKLVQFCDGNDDIELVETRLNNLDRQITEIMTFAEKQCTSLASHHLDSWSPKLVEAFKSKRYWKTKVTAASKMPYYMGLVEAIENFRQAMDKYEEADKRYQELSAKADELRTSFLKERAEAIAKDKGTDAAKEIKSLIETEKTRNQNKRVKRVIKNRTGGGPSSILIPSITEYQQPYPKDFNYMDIEHIWNRIEFDNGEDIRNWDRITDQQQVQSMLLTWQRRHFTQANDTPFASETWREKLQNEDVQEAILSGSFPTIKELPLEANEIISEMKRLDHIDEIPAHTTVNDFRAYIKKIKETRSSSPSGRHYGHYKVLLGQDDKYLTVIHGILQLALTHNVVLQRWSKTVTSLIGKKLEHHLFTNFERYISSKVTYSF